VEEHSALRVDPRHDCDAPTDPSASPQLLAYLALEACLERLAGLAFAAGELPQPAEMLGRVSPGHEEAPAALDDRRGHLDHREAGARGQLAEERKEGSAVGRPHGAVTARVRRVEEDHDLPSAVAVASPVVVRKTHGGTQDGASGDGAHGDDDLGSEHCELGGEERLASTRFARQGAPIARSGVARLGSSRGPALDGVGQIEEILEVEPETPDLAAHEHSPGPGPLPPVLDAGDARSLADQDEPRVAPAHCARRKLPPGGHGRTGATRRDAA